MPVFNNILAGAAGQTGGAAAAGPIKSVRFNSGDSAHLSRTPSSAGDLKKWTWAGWVKRSGTAGQQIFSAGTGTEERAFIRFLGGSDTLCFEQKQNSTWNTTLRSSAVFRDFSAWYHIVVAYDSAQSTESNRVKMYVNGAEITEFGSDTYPPENQDGKINTTTIHAVGTTSYSTSTTPFSGYMADVYFIDGQALDHTSFGAFDGSGVWQPAEYDGTFGTNGFHLFDFANESTVGHDSSGNENDFTANNISTTAGAGNDVLFDVPTNGTQSDSGAGGEVSGNYCTLNPIAFKENNYGTFSQGNLTFTTSSDAQSVGREGTIAVSSGKWYWELAVDQIGTGTAATQYCAGVVIPGYQSGRQDNALLYRESGSWNNDIGATLDVSSPPSYQAGDLIGFALDLDNNKFYVAKNGVWAGSGDPANNTNPSATLPAGLTLTAGLADYWATSIYTFNFGQRAFAYTAPSGFKALCTTNLPTPTIADGSDYFDIATYGGGANSYTISGLSFSPDLVWSKRRDSAGRPALVDTVRGATIQLSSDRTAAELTVSDGLEQFNSDGYVVGTDAGEYGWNGGTSSTFVNWIWDVGSSFTPTVSGFTSPSGRRNTTAGFSIVKVTGNNTVSSFDHGLGVAPALIISKNLDNAYNWGVYHEAVEAAPTQKFLNLNDTDAVASKSGNIYRVVSSSSVEVDSYAETGSNGDYIYYCFAPVAGYSAFGSYEGNGDPDGPFVYTGFRPALIMVKRTDSTGNWVMMDSSRDEYNYSISYLEANDNAAEGTFAGNGFSLLSNGFKLEQATNSTNASGGDYIYMAWAENPFSSNGGLAR